MHLCDEFEGEERDRFEEQLLALANRGETIASNRMAIAAIPISASEVLPNRRLIGRREATRTGRLLTSKNVTSNEHDEKRMLSLKTINTFTAAATPRAGANTGYYRSECRPGRYPAYVDSIFITWG